MILKRIEPFSLGRVLGVIYAAIGLFAGAFIALASMVGLGLGDGDLAAGFLFGGVFAVILLPVLYGIGGLIGGAVIAFLYNLAADWLGGLELTLE